MDGWICGGPRYSKQLPADAGPLFVVGGNVMFGGEVSVPLVLMLLRTGFRRKMYWARVFTVTTDPGLLRPLVRLPRCFVEALASRSATISYRFQRRNCGLAAWSLGHVLRILQRLGRLRCDASGLCGAVASGIMGGGYRTRGAWLGQGWVGVGLLGLGMMHA